MGQRERGKSSKTDRNIASHVVLDLKMTSTTKLVTIMYKDIRLGLKPSAWCVYFMFTISLIRIVRWMHNQGTRTSRTSRRRKEKEIERETLGIFTPQEPFAVLGAVSVSVYAAFTLGITAVSFRRTVSASVQEVILQSYLEHFGCHQQYWAEKVIQLLMTD